MKKIVIASGLLCSLIVVGQNGNEQQTDASSGKQRYENPEKGYSVDLPKYTDIKQMGKYADKFSMHASAASGLSYMVLIAKAPGAGSDGSAEMKNAFKKGILNTCNCELMASKEVTFKHVKGFQLKTRSKEATGDEFFLGYTIMLTHNKDMYTVTFYSAESLFARNEPLFFEMMDTFELK